MLIDTAISAWINRNFTCAQGRNHQSATATKIQPQPSPDRTKAISKRCTQGGSWILPERCIQK
jgi:hypothetical protein